MTLLVFPGCQTTRETDRLRIPLLRETVDVRTTRIGKIQQTPHLVEGFTGSIVKGPAEFTDIGRDVINEKQIRVSARDHQTDETLWEGAIGEFVDGEVADNVIDPVQRLSN